MILLAGSEQASRHDRGVAGLAWNLAGEVRENGCPPLVGERAWHGEREEKARSEPRPPQGPPPALATGPAPDPGAAMAPVLQGRGAGTKAEPARPSRRRVPCAEAGGWSSPFFLRFSTTRGGGRLRARLHGLQALQSLPHGHPASEAASLRLNDAPPDQAPRRVVSPLLAGGLGRLGRRRRGIRNPNHLVDEDFEGDRRVRRDAAVPLLPVH
jgi:hypothetical protein